MSKRSFRPTRAARSSATYPLEREGRRAFLRQLGGLVLGGAAVGVLAACGDRDAVGTEEPDHLGGVPDRTPAPLDGEPLPPSVDAGVAPPMDAAIDTQPPGHDTSGVPDSSPAIGDGGPPYGDGL